MKIEGIRSSAISVSGYINENDY